MSPAFWVVNTLNCAFVFVLWRLSVLVGISELPIVQVKLSIVLTAIWLVGMVFAFTRRWRSVFHIANLLPMVGLLFTGISIIDVVSGVQSLQESEILKAFRGIGFALAVNFVAIFFMIWLRELAWWDGEEHI